MNDWKNWFKLQNEIIKLSNSTDWIDAKLEWIISDIYKIEEWQNPETCLCSHYPITEICELHNTINWNNVIVWNVCVNKFINENLGTNKLFQAISKIKNDITKSVNIETIKHFYDKCILSEWDKNFYIDIYKKRKLSKKQLDKKILINDKMINWFKKSK